MLPLPLTAQVAGALAARATVPFTATLAGFGAMANATTPTLALPLSPVPESAAVIVAMPVAEPAVNSPLAEIVPALEGLTDQVTLPVAPVTVNCCVCACAILAAEGETITTALATVILTGVLYTVFEVASCA